MGCGAKLAEDERQAEKIFLWIFHSFMRISIESGEGVARVLEIMNASRCFVGMMVVIGDFRDSAFKFSAAINFNLSMNIISRFHLKNILEKVNRHGNKTFRCPRDSNCSFCSLPLLRSDNSEDEVGARSDDGRDQK